MKHIIIVDDRLENRYMLESLLKGVDYRISTAKNGLEALALARKSLPDLVISDILMPVMDGFTLCREWRTDILLKNIPFIFYTAAYTSPQDIKYALRLGADRFLIKPQEPSEFLSVIKDVLDEYEMGRIKSIPEKGKSEVESLKEYNAVLFRKLEDKLIQTEQSDRKLKQYSFELEQNIQKLKISEENLRQTRDYLDNLINYSNDPIIVWNPQLNIIRFNRAFERLTGYDSSEVLGQKLEMLFPENSKKKSRLQIEKTLSGENLESVEIPIQTKQKETRIILWSSASIYDSEGKVQISTIAHGQNVSERRQAEEMLQKYATRLLKLSECLSSLGPDYELNINQLTALSGEIFSARCAVFNLLENGYLYSLGLWQTPPEFSLKDAASGNICYEPVTNKSKEIILINNLSKTHYVASDSLIKACALQTYLGSLVMSEGRPVGTLSLFFQSDLQPNEEDKRILGIIGSAIGNEVTRRQLKLALVKSERLLNKTEMISKIGGWEYDVASKQIKWTNEAYRIYGLKKDSDPKKPDPEIGLFVEHDQNILEQTFESAVLRGEPFDIDLRCMTNDKSQKWIRMMGSPVFEDGKISKLVGNIVDITDRKISEEALKASEAKLKETNATKDKFFSIIAHDLKNPFNAILGFSNILNEEAHEMDVPKIQEYADMINRAAVQVFRLLDNLLSWARLQRDQIPYNPTTLLLKEVTNEVINLLKDNAVRKKISVRNLIPDELMVNADGDMLKTIVRNLISNAIKFTPSNGKITLNAIENNGKVEVSVKDNGKGMSKESLNKLFKLDTSYSTRGTEDEVGTGLGLILCKEFIEKHNGEISVESELDRGTTFKFTLPV
jgi:two-component system, sensor histidine kinase and response regulator